MNDKIKNPEGTGIMTCDYINSKIVNPRSNSRLVYRSPAEVKDGRYLIAKDIPLDPKGETVIKKGREIYLTNGVFYLDSILLAPDYQYDFRELFKNEVKNGWNYVAPANPKMGESIVK